MRIRVEEALYAIPRYFASDTNLEGIEAQDLFSLNSVLGSTLEVQVVDALNHMRDTWDPPLQGSTLGKYAHYSFVRMPQSFPDVRLQKDAAGEPDVLFGVELKGWYLLGKEEEPSYRFKAHPLASGELDMLVVIPWYLRNVLSGQPVALKPYIAPSRWAAGDCDGHWEWKARIPKGSRSPNEGSSQHRRSPRRRRIRRERAR